MQVDLNLSVERKKGRERPLLGSSLARSRTWGGIRKCGDAELPMGRHYREKKRKLHIERVSARETKPGE